MRTYRAQLLVAMMLVTVAITGVGLVIAERKVVAETEHDLELSFQAELDALHAAHEIRRVALTERCRVLVRRPRIVAALEDNALDLLYPSAKDELRDLRVLESTNSPHPAQILRARFYRFLNDDGSVMPADDPEQAGPLKAEEESGLALARLPEQQELGYLWTREADSIVELIAVPILSSERAEPISALVVGLERAQLGTVAGENMHSGILLKGRLYLPALAPEDTARLADEVMRTIASTDRDQGHLQARAGGALYHLFYKHLNPGSMFPAAYEVSLYPLAELLNRQRALRWQATGICVFLLIGGVGASQFLAQRLSQPVEKMAVDSAENLAQRRRAEAALEVTSKELQRAARFSADASHQLKTPVAVLRAGLDELLATDDLPPHAREEVSSLIHQTFRLNNIIEDLLLLSRMDAGRLEVKMGAVNLAQVVEAWLDDFSTLSDSKLEIQTDLPPDLCVAGEKRYTTIIVENLLENARKYNRPGGRISVAIRQEDRRILFLVGNTGRTIPPAMQDYIFERFHRGTAGENVPGYGLGLNLARELARLHGGDLRLLRSQADWTEFEACFWVAQQDATAADRAI